MDEMCIRYVWGAGGGLHYDLFWCYLLNLLSITLVHIDNFPLLGDGVTPPPPTCFTMVLETLFVVYMMLLNYYSRFQVWRFLVTFADVLGLWPFTLDEFVQAFHDYVSP